MSQPLTEPHLTDEIRKHYDILSSFYHLLWGPHIHHGYWEDGEGVAEAQIKLIERLAAKLEIATEQHVLDIGSGLGGSTCWLAKTFRCSVLGLTLSPVQAEAGEKRAVDEGVADRVRFEVHDANELDVPDETFDRIWIIECSEHIHDKERFFADCFRLLRPAGRLGLCAWLKGDSDTPEHREIVDEICAAMLCPSLLTMGEQVAMLERAGFEAVETEDVTTNVLPTWQHCRKVATNPMVRLMLHGKGGKLRRFIDSFELMEKGYREGAMAYGMITASKS